MAGYGAASIALRHTDLFGQFASLAGYFHLDDPSGVVGGSGGSGATCADRLATARKDHCLLDSGIAGRAGAHRVEDSVRDVRAPAYCDYYTPPEPKLRVRVFVHAFVSSSSTGVRSRGATLASARAGQRGPACVACSTPARIRMCGRIPKWSA